MVVVRAGRIVRESVYGDADEEAGDRSLADIDNPLPHPEVVGVTIEAEPGLVLGDDEIGGRVLGGPTGGPTCLGGLAAP